MTDPTTAKHHANAAYAIALGMEAAANQGVPDVIIAEELTRITLALIASTSGGESGLADWLEREAAAIRERGNSVQPSTVN
jgi:hypothetical protein